MIESTYESCTLLEREREREREREEKPPSLAIQNDRLLIC
jgi:hypothetical protein